MILEIKWNFQTYDDHRCNHRLLSLCKLACGILRLVLNTMCYRKPQSFSITHSADSTISNVLSLVTIDFNGAVRSRDYIEEPLVQIIVGDESSIGRECPLLRSL